MSKKTFFQRNISIIKKLKTKPYSSYEDIFEFIDREQSYKSGFDSEEEWSYSKRTFQRDIKEIEEVWGITIEFDKKRKGYFINEDNSFHINHQNLLEVFEMMTAFNLTEDLSDIVQQEQRKAANTHYFDDIIQAIKKKTYLNITYRKFDTDESQMLKIAPYGLKEYKQRWYLIATSKGQLRTYALDRMEELSITPDRYPKDDTIQLGSLFHDVIGIYTLSDAKLTTVKLRVASHFVPYLLTLPLHHSQQVINTTQDYTDFAYLLKITEDLYTELKSYGSNVVVLEPLELREKILQDLQATLKLYK